MPTIDLDFTDVEAFTVIPKGNYPIEVTDANLRQSEGGEYPYIAWTLRVIEGEHAGTPLTFNTSFSPKALWRMQAVFKSLGVYTEKMAIQADDETGTILEPELVGLQGTAAVKIDLYQGTRRNVVETIGPLTVQEAVVEAPAARAPVTSTPDGAVAHPGPVTQRPAPAARKGMNLK